jgi:hypothetical protein
MSYLRKILSGVDPNISAKEIAKRLVRMCMENRGLCEKYLYDHDGGQ